MSVRVTTAFPGRGRLPGPELELHEYSFREGIHDVFKKILFTLQINTNVLSLFNF